MSALPKELQYFIEGEKKTFVERDASFLINDYHIPDIFTRYFGGIIWVDKDWQSDYFIIKEFMDSSN